MALIKITRKNIGMLTACHCLIFCYKYCCKLICKIIVRNKLFLCLFIYRIFLIYRLCLFISFSTCVYLWLYGYVSLLKVDSVWTLKHKNKLFGIILYDKDDLGDWLGAGWEHPWGGVWVQAKPIWEMIIAIGCDLGVQGSASELIS